MDPDWRREVSQRVHAYRARHGIAEPDLQPALPFEPAHVPQAGEPQLATDSRSKKPARQAPLFQPRQGERFDITVSGQGIGSRTAGNQSGFGRVGPAGASPDPLVPVASLSDRRRAALVDAALVLFSYGGMLALFWTLGGHIEFQKIDIAVAGATLILLYAQYFALFTIFGGSTPGMMLHGLCVVAFNGGVPKPCQLMWRSFGYLVSAGTCFLGFLWALWDDDHLCWQDRISETYLTHTEGVPGNEPHSPGGLSSGLSC